MTDNELVENETGSLDELIETRLQDLLDKLAGPHTTEELEAEISSLNELIQSYKLRDEMLEKLLDSSTPEENRRQIIETLREQRIKIIETRGETEQLHAKSHQLMERSALLIRQAQEQVNKRKR